MHKSFAIIIAVFVSGWFFTIAPNANAETRSIIFPVIGATTYSNDWGAPRVGHTHIGNDIFGVKGQPLVAAVSGTIRQVAYPEPSYGWYLSLTDAEGYQYNYLHINDDTPGTDDGKGGAVNAYAFGSSSGWPVRAGQIIAYMGDSGNAESTRPHLHFEIEDPEGNPFNPYFSLQAARKIKTAKSRPRRENEVVPFPGLTVGLRVTAGQLDPLTETQELVVAQSNTKQPLVRVFSGPVRRLSEFTVRDAIGSGGVDVATGDTNGDGTDEIIVGFGRGSEPYVQVTSHDGAVLSSFLAYPQKFRGGLNVATADLDGDGRDEIITGAGPGGGPEVRVFQFTGELVASFNAYEGEFRGGVDIDGFSATTGAAGTIVTVSGPGRVTEARIFSSLGTLVNAWNVYTSATVNGGRIAAWPGTDTADSVAIIPARKSSSLIYRYGLDGTRWDDGRAFERWWFGDFDVGMWNGQLIAATGVGRPTVVVPISLRSNYSWWDLNFSR